MTEQKLEHHLTHVISAPDVLQRLEKTGFDFGSIALGLPSGSGQSTSDYGRHLGYGDLVATLKADLAEQRARDPHLGVGMRHAHRGFDAAWLSSPVFNFELVGVVPRIDRRAFSKAPTCGELRFIYRLRYSGTGPASQSSAPGPHLESRMPMTANVVRWLQQTSDRCASWARAWKLPKIEELPAEEYVRHLTAPSGPLSDEALAQISPKSVEVNLQSARWPSTVRPNMAGHAEYILRVFHPHGEHWRPAPMENTPDVRALTRSPSLQKDLVTWLTQPEQLKAADEGTLVLPERFSATRALSVAPHGLSRRHNRPFAQVLETQPTKSSTPLTALAEVDFSGYQTFSSSQEYIRRLDAMSCPGCHQTKSVAGFHFLGADDPTRKADVLAVVHSSHFTEEYRRRHAYLTALLSDSAPSEFRPSPERMRSSGGYGAHCALEDGRLFKAWTCEEGLRCTASGDPDVGYCMPAEKGPGDSCETGLMRTHHNAHRDFLSLSAPESCGENAVCERNGVGFPLGMCSQSCKQLPESAQCGLIAQLTGFNACLARNESFEQCILSHSRPGALRGCSMKEPCREDYVCARMPGGGGACIPPYFLFQLRVDGHIVPQQ